MLELEQNSEGFHAAGSHSQAGACRQWGFLWLRITAWGRRSRNTACSYPENGNISVHSAWGNLRLLKVQSSGPAVLCRRRGL